MLSRTRSIFHIEEEGEKDDMISNGVFEVETDGLVGLQILIKHGGIDSKVLIKSSMKKKKPVEHLSADFLKSCFLCSKELSLQKEVYMYRGDQGFCSVECRYKQILQDERKEFDSTRRQRFGLPNHQHERAKIQESCRRSKISVSA